MVRCDVGVCTESKVKTVVFPQSFGKPCGFTHLGNPVYYAQNHRFRFSLSVLTQNQSGPIFHPGRQPLVEDLMQEQHGLAVQEYRTDVLVRARRFLRAGRHTQRPQETRDQHLQLTDVLFLGFDHAKHETGGEKRQLKQTSPMWKPNAYCGAFAAHGNNRSVC